LNRGDAQANLLELPLMNGNSASDLVPGRWFDHIFIIEFENTVDYMHSINY
jgi:hypothetical protein